MRSRLLALKSMMVQRVSSMDRPSRFALSRTAIIVTPLGQFSLKIQLIQELPQRAAVQGPIDTHEE